MYVSVRATIGKPESLCDIMPTRHDPRIKVMSSSNCVVH
ncbi:hypothetical protein E2C01_050235 [Portunus trituberculatus]|uniref:Uncharacterized protein n=1 Tax=Portunus trituberculatus TaxID=210409 RepID=A0A5B7GBI8_PORTR|nr:hypothetical protein [Portunus trituberculatus]